MGRNKDFKRCPRCDRKVLLHQPKCQNCGLVFARLSKATNDAAKKALRKKEYNKVIYDKVLPRDMKKWKLFLITLFLGWCGGQHYYVGRTGKGITASITFLMLFVAAFLPIEWWMNYYLEAIMWVLITPQAFTTIFWIVAVFAVLFNKYKVPIAIDEELVLQEEYDSKLVKEVLKEVGKDESALTKNKDAKNKETKEVVEEKKAEKKSKDKKPPKPKTVKVVCKNCGHTVKVEVDEKICPNCEENIYGEE